MSASIAGELSSWPTKDEMTRILCDAGLQIQAGQYSIRVTSCSHFVFREYGGDLGEPTVEADADTVTEMTEEARLVSRALALAGVRHRFEIYDDSGVSAGYLHHQWPLAQELERELRHPNSEKGQVDRQSA